MIFSPAAYTGILLGTILVLALYARVVVRNRRTTKQKMQARIADIVQQHGR